MFSNVGALGIAIGSDTTSPKGLKAFKEDFPEARLIIVSLEDQPRLVNEVEVYPAMQFLNKLWNGEII